MTDRHNKLNLLAEGKLNAKQRADFYYRTSKVIEKELAKIKELSILLEATPDSYLEKIDFTKAALDAMKLTELLIKKADPTHISTVQELTDGSTRIQAERFYLIKLGNSLPGIKNATIDLDVIHMPAKEEILFDRMIRAHRNNLVPVTRDNKLYSLKEFLEEILPRLKSIDPNLEIKDRGILGYAPEEELNPDSGPREVDPKLIESVRELSKKLGIERFHGNLTVIPDYSSVEDETMNLFLKGDYPGASHKVITEMKARQKKEES